ncbi:pesticin domain-containing protein [Vibrio phage VBM1]|uniref:pesticin domain-containing protein n=1 Tax=Vibrio phage VBM1 TaxID=754074 RepID=UPI0002C0D35D|nr:pesticin domain-containing protein [Vibrio phage VBM1]AGH07329.1 pesticin domain-containing protein [Vibrio phage VBM1]
MKNIDFGFICELEGFETVGYVPDPEGSNSGVTIASGFDLGQRSKHELLTMLPTYLAEKLIPYIGKTKFLAVDYLKAHPLSIKKKEAILINELSHSQSVNQLVKSWEQARPYCKFSELPKEKATVIASVAFQYGDLRRRTPNFWRQVTQGDWGGALNNLRHFGDKYPTRRNKEADLLEGSMR